MNDVRAIASYLADIGKPTHVLVEVQYDDDVQCDDCRDLPPTKCRHAMYWIDHDGNISLLGKQHFARRGELNGTKGNLHLEAFEKNLPSRAVKIGELAVIALCCGELNILQGRNSVSCVSQCASTTLDGADIVINPTHDRMGNGGTLNAKRRYLSRVIEGRSRVAVSVSNWDHAGEYEDGTPRGRQRPDTLTLHTVFRDGEPLNPVLKQGGSNEGFHYREWNINAKT